MRLRNRLFKGTALNFVAVTFSQGSTLIVNIVVARILLKDTFGEYAMVQNTLLTAAGLSQLATGYTASKYVAEYRSVDPERAGRIMGLCAAISILMAGMGAILLAVTAPLLANNILGAPHLTSGLMIGSCFLFFSAINGYQTGALSGLESYRSLAKAGILSGILTVAAIAFCTWQGGLNGAVVGLGLSSFFRCAIHNRHLRLESRAQGIAPQYRGSLGQEKAIIFKFALPAAIAGYYSMPMIWLGNYFLVRQPGGYGEMAFYAAAINIKSILLFIPFVVNGVISSILNHIKGMGDRGLYSLLYRFNLAFVLLSTLAAGLALGAFGSGVLGLFGKSFTTGKTILLLMLASGVLEATTGSLYQRIQNSGKMWLSFLSINLPLGLLFVILAFLFVPIHGAIGLGMANVVMNACSLLGTGILAYKIGKDEMVGPTSSSPCPQEKTKAFELIH